MVVAGHSTDYLIEQNGWLPPQLLWLHGPAGVDIFFVISGFVMMISSSALLRQPNPGRTFLLRRLIRIVPLYWLLTTVRLILLAWRPQLAEHTYPSVWNIVCSFLFIPSVGASGEIRPVIPLGWTLSFEMAFYVIFAIGLVASGRILRIVTPAILLLAVVGLFRTSSWPVWTAIADPIVLEFLGGVWIARWAIAGRLPGRLPAAFGVAAGFIGLALLSPSSLSSRPFTWGLCAAVIVTGTVAVEEVVGARLPRWLLLLGNASYSIYLVQVFVFPLLHYMLSLLQPDLVHQHALLAGIVLIISSLLVTSGVAIFMYKWIERPATIGLRGLFDASKPVAVTP